MSYIVKYLPEAKEDFKNLAANQRILVAKAIKKVSQNPVSIFEGGYGKPLGNRKNADLAGFLKIKLKSAGIRVVYKVIKTEKEMLIVIIGIREDDEVYELADKRIQKNDL